MAIIDQVREALRCCTLTRYEIAKQTGIDQAALLRFVRGGSLRIESIEKLCPVLGLRLTLTSNQPASDKGIDAPKKQRQRRS